MSLSRGDVVIALFLNADGSGSKPRPVLVIQADVYNAKIKNLIVAAVTTNLKHAGDPASLWIIIHQQRSVVDGVGAQLFARAMDNFRGSGLLL